MKKLLIEEIKADILGKRYELSVVFIGKKDIKSLNKKYRKKNEATDVLSFAISDKIGEIFICSEIAKKKAKSFSMTFKNYLLFLVIHAILHLKGMRHGSKMEGYEFAYYSRYRCGHL